MGLYTSFWILTELCEILSFGIFPFYQNFLLVFIFNYRNNPQYLPGTKSPLNLFSPRLTSWKFFWTVDYWNNQPKKYIKYFYWLTMENIGRYSGNFILIFNDIVILKYKILKFRTGFAKIRSSLINLLQFGSDSNTLD